MGSACLVDKFYFCIDIGGTALKGGIVSADNNLLCVQKIKTEPETLPDYICKRIMALIELLQTASGKMLKDAQGLAIGVAGLVNSKCGEVKYSPNLNLKEYPLKRKLEKFIDIPIMVANDADVATLAEKNLGAGKIYNNFIMLTIGTGIGCGIVIDGKLLGISVPYSSEIGHMKTTDSGLKCACGDSNCFEALASTKALVAQTKAAMKANPQSKMWSKYTLASVNGKTVFEFLDSDPTARKVFNNYIEHLGNGIVSLYNIFMPEAVVLGGAISCSKDKLTKPLSKFVDKHIYASNIGIKSNIISAEFTGDAGIVGGRFLFD